MKARSLLVGEHPGDQEDPQGRPFVGPRANCSTGRSRRLGARLGIDWLAAPFSRCLVDNAPLRPASVVEVVSVPEAARQGDGPLLACPECARVYWPGSHVRRMRARLERSQQL